MRRLKEEKKDQNKNKEDSKSILWRDLRERDRIRVVQRIAMPFGAVALAVMSPRVRRGRRGPTRY